VHTFRLVNARGRSTFVKFHWTPVAGTHSLDWDESVKIAGADPDYTRRDLWESNPAPQLGPGDGSAERVRAPLLEGINLTASRAERTPPPGICRISGSDLGGADSWFAI